MSKQWGHGYNVGEKNGVEIGTNSGEFLAGHKIANEMRVILCALITAHKREDSNAFWATVEIAKTVVGKYANFNDEDWAVFRKDSARKDIDA
jgi:hypothetical protein